MTERELVTLALGNYATLVAAQWANGTTSYDVAHNTLYTERHLRAVCGGAVDNNRSELQSGTDGLIRVPRLVLLDAPHATRLRCKPSLNAAAAVQNEESEGEHEQNETRIYDDDDDDDDDESESEKDAGGDDAESRYYTRGEVGTGVFLQGDSLAMNSETHETGAFDAQRSTSETAVSSFQKSQPSLKAIKRRLFREKDDLIPWWQYICSGVASDAVHVLHPLHRIGGIPTAGGNDIPLLHNFGFGMSHLRSSVSSNVADVVESLRRQLEDADLLQGLQCFVDGDSAFGGAACNIMEEFWEDAGSKVPATFFCCFQTLPEEVAAAHSDVDFADRRKDEQCLNRLLATAKLSSHDSAVYVPMELAQWRTSFASSSSLNGSTHLAPKAAAWLQDDTATAQVVASFADTTLYGTRDEGKLNTGGCGGPAFYMQDWQAAVRPTRCLRVASALTSMPMPVHDVRLPRGDLWDFLQRNPLLQTSCGEGGGYFAPLTHAVSSGPEKESGRVLGHAVTLRGAGQLHDLTYPRQEALLRYALPLRSGNYLPLITDNSYPISSTFPRDFVLPNELVSSGALQGIDMGSHIVSTYDSAPMLQSIVAQAQKVVRRSRHLHEASYEMDGDEWKEVLEDVMVIRDDYYHPADEDYADNGDDISMN
ncbi:Tubulin/FtsZ family, putative [Trypanosoma equiperdum]|uniref:Tubulin/FtsZ family, putative n=1 Tax=Trypanosoma equiperdum TaxID=5694 RepID=A0A1G4IB21_TRYEQ|nr:Tubulin/FtsZ family, putative [Trypanosoma equiperdum]